MKRKGWVVLSTIITLSIISLTLPVSAQEAFLDGFERVWQGIIEFLNIILTPLFGSSFYGGYASGDILLIRILVFTVVIAIVWSVVDKMKLFGVNTWARVVTAIAASVLATRFLATPEWVETILLPYSVLGIAITALLPLIILFFLIEKSDFTKTLRKTAWIFVAVVFLVLWMTRTEEIAAQAGEKFNPALIYAITAFICLLFFIFDGTIRNAMRLAEVERMNNLSVAHQRVAIQREIKKVQDDINGGSTYSFDSSGKITGITYKTIYNNLKGMATAAGIPRAIDPLPHPA